MGTKAFSDTISSVLFGKTRRVLLGLLFANTDREFYVQQLIKAVGSGRGALQRELTNLEKAGIIRRLERGNMVYYKANSDCPIYEDLRSIVLKTVGIGDVLVESLSSLTDRIYSAFFYGSFATGAEDRFSDIDLFIVGDISLLEIVRALGHAQIKLGREINPTIYPVPELQEKFKEGHHFVKSVLEGPKQFIIGGSDELEGLVK
jgi:predicted nucleotidyltransferase